jgi:hypothetical protein
MFIPKKKMRRIAIHLTTFSKKTKAKKKKKKPLLWLANHPLEPGGGRTTPKRLVVDPQGVPGVVAATLDEYLGVTRPPTMSIGDGNGSSPFKWRGTY